jgi:phytanoyl-CoA hydroxylase
MGHKEDFDRDGFLVLEKTYSARGIDAVMAAVDALIARRPAQVTIDDMASGERMSLRDAGPKTRASRLKINDLYLEMPEVRSLAVNAKMSRILTNLLGQPPLLCNSLYLQKGSTQSMHIDSLYMTPITLYNLIAIWVAMEDAHPDSGQLEYYPGSHKISPMKFSDGSYHVIVDEMPRWDAYVASEIERLGLQKKSFGAKKGDVFIWHANLLHGGGPIRDMSRTRKSFVFHYFALSDGHKITGEKIADGSAFWLKRPHPNVPQKVAATVSFNLAPENFVEDRYLARHPDVRAAIGRGEFKSGKHHYEIFGMKEGRPLR